jgi:hypothetical protein
MYKDKMRIIAYIFWSILNHSFLYLQRADNEQNENHPTIISSVGPKYKITSKLV